MTHYGAKELAESFRTVRTNTIQIAEDIPEDNYSFSPAPDVRTVEKMLTHIALSYRFQFRIHGVDRRSNLDGFDFVGIFQELMDEESKPRTKAEVIQLLQNEGGIWSNFVESLSDEFLSETVSFPEGATPPARSRLEMVLSVKEHEMHHRGQLMLVERMLGIVPHLTRRMQERMAQAQADAAKA